MLTCGTAFGLSRTRKGAWTLTDVTDELMQLVHKDFSKRMPHARVLRSDFVCPPTSSTEASDVGLSGPFFYRFVTEALFRNHRASD